MTSTLASRLLDAARGMNAAGLSVGTAGNLSVRRARGFLITPTGLPFEQCGADDMVAMTMGGRSSGVRAPSSEWRIHRDIYRARPEAGAILHAHSPFATAIACHRQGIPAFHYMIARFGGSNVRCAHYATFGTQALSDHALEALEDRSACLLANHGMIVFGCDCAHALALGIEFEALCRHYLESMRLGNPALLSPDEMTEVLARFGSYGQPPG